ncbi:MAG TPA: hypothetical protein DHM42_03055 [Clostridiales bacterium]|nr:hypothetical protein [Clostridiales bacterium]
MFIFYHIYSIVVLGVIYILQEVYMDFILGQSKILLYAIIFFAKIFEVSIGTLRIVLVSKGQKAKAALIAFVECIIWVLVVSTVLVDITSDPIKVVIYCAAFAIGNYIGVTLENRLAMGLSSIQVITEVEEGNELAKLLRDNNFGVTVMRGEGKEKEKEILVLHLKRKRITEAVNLIHSQIENALITVNEVKVVRGGYIKRK